MNLDLDKLTKFEFIKKYGHLRPSTYDINSINYEEGYNVYFANTKKIKRTKKTFRLKNWQKKSIKKLLKINKLNISTDKFINFIKKAVAGREKQNFIFLKT